MPLKPQFMKIIHQNIFPIFNMNCHHCKKNLTNSEIFFKLDLCFCSDKCRQNISKHSHKQSQQYHPYLVQKTDEIYHLHQDHSVSPMFVSSASWPN